MLLSPGEIFYRSIRDMIFSNKKLIDSCCHIGVTNARSPILSLNQGVDSCLIGNVVKVKVVQKITADNVRAWRCGELRDRLAQTVVE